MSEFIDGGKIVYMRSLNFAIVGCGRVAPRHADSIVEIKNANLLAVCDNKKDRADRFGREYKARVYYDFKKLLKDPQIDVVNICTPSGLHAQMAIETARAGKHIICEKPMALNSKDAKKMISECRKNKVKLCIVLQNRYNRAMGDLKKVVERKKLGKINLGSVCVRWFRPQSYYGDDWHGKWEMDGGAVMNQSIHHLDALIWTMGMPKSVFAYWGTLVHKTEVEDCCVAVFKYKNGSLAVFEGSTIIYPENLEGSIALFGDKGSVKVGGTALNRKVFWKIKDELDKEKKNLSQNKADPKSVYGSSHKFVIKDMIESVLKNREPRTDGIEGYESLKLVLAIYESARNNKEVKIDGDESSI